MLARGAAAAIIVCADPSLEVCAGYWVQNCSAATENLLLAAYAMGYGATWCGIYPLDDRVGSSRRYSRSPSARIKEISRETGLHRNTVAKYLKIISNYTVNAL